MTDIYKKRGKPLKHLPIKNVETGDIFETYTEAANFIGGDRTNIKRVAHGVQSHHKGYHFIFVDAKE